MEVTVDREERRRSGWFRKFWRPKAGRQPTGQGPTPGEMIRRIDGLERELLREPELPQHMREKLQRYSIDGTCIAAMLAFQQAQDSLLEVSSAKVQQFIDSELSPLQNRLFGLHFQDELSVPQIVERLGIDRKTVLRELTQAYSRFRGKFCGPEESVEALVARFGAATGTDPR